MGRADAENELELACYLHGSIMPLFVHVVMSRIVRTTGEVID